MEQFETSAVLSQAWEEIGEEIERASSDRWSEEVLEAALCYSTSLSADSEVE